MRLYRSLLQCTYNIFVESNVYNVFENAAITATCNQSAREGARVLAEGGSAVDCAITTELCAGVRSPERLGIGGGFVAIVYNRTEQRARVLLAREVAPKRATLDLFKSQHKGTLFGGKATAVPGALRGYWELHRRYGRLPWRRLFEPAIRMCRNGVYVQPFTYYGLKQVEKEIYKSNSLRHILVDPFTGKVKTARHKIYRPKLARTLEEVATTGPDALYAGKLTEGFVRDIQAAGGVITARDLAEYHVQWLEPLQLNLGQLKILTTPPPTCGAVLLCALQILNSDNTFVNSDLPERWHRIIEVWKHCYGFRSRLGDPRHCPETLETVHEMLQTKTTDQIINRIKSKATSDFRDYGGRFQIPDDNGTAHFNVLSSEGDAVSVTDSINTLFGAMFMSETTGIILNNTINDFAIPGVENVFAVPVSAANVLAPDKTPLTSMVPSIAVDAATGNVRLLIGGAGGTKIISSVSLVLLRHLLLGENIREAVEASRLHHQLLPMHLEYEIEFSEDVLHQLWLRGHFPRRMVRQAVVGVISRPIANGPLYAMGDSRRHCANSGF